MVVLLQLCGSRERKSTTSAPADGRGLRGGHAARLRLGHWRGYCTETPFQRAGVAVVKIDHDAEGERIRTLEPGEEAVLLQHAGRHLKAIIVACAGMRSTASSTRRPPTCSEMRPEARVRSVQRAWQTCVLKAHGSTPEWEKRPHTGPDSCGNRRPGGQFTPACREALARIKLAGSRSTPGVWLLAAGVIGRSARCARLPWPRQHYRDQPVSRQLTDPAGASTGAAERRGRGRHRQFSHTVCTRPRRERRCRRRHTRTSC